MYVRVCTYIVQVHFLVVEHITFLFLSSEASIVTFSRSVLSLVLRYYFQVYQNTYVVTLQLL